MDALQIEKAIVAGCDWGARTADIIAALWPERCKALVSVSGYLIGSQALGRVPLPPKAELQWWYQYYFATERGRAGYDKYRRDFAKLIWAIASPKWNFDDATFERSAAALDNPDHVSIVIHNYRWRLGLAEGEPQYEALEKRLAEAPVITVPTITLEGDANGAPHPEPGSYAGKFSGKYSHRTLSGGIGHNLPQEAPQAFAEAIAAAAHPVTGLVLLAPHVFVEDLFTWPASPRRAARSRPPTCASAWAAITATPRPRSGSGMTSGWRPSSATGTSKTCWGTSPRRRC